MECGIKLIKMSIETEIKTRKESAISELGERVRSVIEF